MKKAAKQLRDIVSEVFDKQGGNLMCEIVEHSGKCHLYTKHECGRCIFYSKARIVSTIDSFINEIHVNENEEPQFSRRDIYRGAYRLLLVGKPQGMVSKLKTSTGVWDIIADVFTHE